MTIGRNFCVSCCSSSCGNILLQLCRHQSAHLSILYAHILIASTSSVLASGTACSAARFSPVSNSSCAAGEKTLSMRLKVGKRYLDFVISQEAIFHAQFRHRDRRTCAKASFKALTASGLLGLLRSIASALALKTNLTTNDANDTYECSLPWIANEREMPLPRVRRQQMKRLPFPFEIKGSTPAATTAPASRTTL